MRKTVSGFEFRALAVALAMWAAACGPTRYDYPEQIAGTEQNDPLGEQTDAGRGYLLDRWRESEPGTEPDADTPKPEEKPEPASAPAAAPSTDAGSLIWRATLDTFAGTPVVTADAKGGVLITDWYAEPGRPNERMKAQATVLSNEIGRGAVNVSVFRQELRNGTWTNLPLTLDAGSAYEARILERARELRDTAR